MTKWMESKAMSLASTPHARSDDAETDGNKVGNDNDITDHP
eukprot:CAMPEP_0197826424 /NCGR_PEP_ID=MMETSP1437-20131217/3385_1 /TAXON_ID=49252 ORGANISM="Eucampia antarctica, Strain CCMP1452" /NCGR_SAMPLE_ID=MMETSP1437 /ASSEMBLY_ACC=CAM_ASM_001096 /LENGTH=40 /DNA_ID= /DNA_START= /DNA_END= /DNA_ORIENTATION=